MNDTFDFDTFVMAYFEKHPPLLHFAGESSEEWYVWQKRLRTRLLDLMDPFPEQVPAGTRMSSKSESNLGCVTRKWYTPLLRTCRSRHGS